MHAMAKFRQYLVGSKFCVKTDHNSLKHFLGQWDLNERQQKWVSKLQFYDFDISFVKGTQNIVVDALSRRLHLSSMAAVSEDWKHLIIAEYAKNPLASDIIDGIVQDNRYSLANDLIIYKERIFLVPGFEVKCIVLRTFHDSPMVGHSGYFKTYRQERFSWKGLMSDVFSTFESVLFANRTSMSTTFLQGYFSRFLFLIGSGNACLWTSSRACLKPRVVTTFMW